MLHFYTPPPTRKHQKTRDFRIISGGTMSLLLLGLLSKIVFNDMAIKWFDGFIQDGRNLVLQGKLYS